MRFPFDLNVIPSKRRTSLSGLKARGLLSQTAVAFVTGGAAAVAVAAFVTYLLLYRTGWRGGIPRKR